MLFFREIAGNICFDFDLSRQIVVLDGVIAAPGNCPNAHIAVGGHDVKNFHLAHHDIGIRLPKPRQFGATTKDVVSVDHAITTKPVVILVEHSLPQPL